MGHRTSKHISTEVTPFSLIYEFELMVPIEARFIHLNIPYSHARIYNVEALDEKRQNTEEKWLSYQRQITRAYNKRLRPKTLKIGDLVFKAARHMRPTSVLLFDLSTLKVNWNPAMQISTSYTTIDLHEIPDVY